VVERPTALASSVVDGATMVVPSAVITTGSVSAPRSAACSSRPPSGSSAAIQRYGTALRARKSRAANDGADQRCPITLVSAISTSGWPV
jgi:hypothetical protein